jgi:hypothetical protein
MTLVATGFPIDQGETYWLGANLGLKAKGK